MIKVSCEVQNYDNPSKQDLFVHNHWNDDRMVVLEINGERFTVSAEDLQKAIANCTNINRYG